MTETTPLYDANDYDALQPTPIDRRQASSSDPNPYTSAATSPIAPGAVASAHPEPNAFIPAGPSTLEERLRAKRRARVFPIEVLPVSELQVQHRRLDLPQLIALGLLPDVIKTAIDRAMAASEQGGAAGGATVSLSNLNQMLIRHVGLEAFAKSDFDLDRAMCVGGAVRARLSDDEPWVDMRIGMIDELDPEDIKALSVAIQGEAAAAAKSDGAAADPADAVGTARARDGVREPAERAAGDVAARPAGA